MNANDFAQALEKSAPLVECLVAVGLSREGAELFRQTQICQRRTAPLPTNVTNELIELASRWDVSKVEIGMIRLLGTPIDQERTVQVGLVEADPLVIVKVSSELLVEEAGTAGHVLWKVALGPSNFLDALVVAAKFLADRAVGIVDFDDIEIARTTAVRCAELAGGNSYLEFYLMLCGVE